MVDPTSENAFIEQARRGKQVRGRGESLAAKLRAWHCDGQITTDEAIDEIERESDDDASGPDGGVC